jgi:nicotinamide riboside kinase
MGMDSELNKKVWVIAGGECSGKTTLFESLQSTLPQYQFVSEYNRIWLEARGITAPFTTGIMDTLFEACLVYYQNIDVSIPTILDTDLLNLFLWAKSIEHPSVVALQEEWANTQFNYLLCSPDIPYVSDPLRSGWEIREWSWEQHLHFAKQRHHFVLKSNDAASRFLEAKEIILSAE